MPRPPRAQNSSNVRKRRGLYQVNWRDPLGRRRWRSFVKKNDALRFLRQQQVATDQVRAGLSVPQETNMTWEDLVGHWKVKKARKRSLRDDLGRIRNHLDPELARAGVVEIASPRVITRVEKAMRDKVKAELITNTTSKKILVLLHGMLRVAKREGWIGAVPEFEFPKDEQRDYAWIREDDEIRRFLKAARAYDYLGLMELYATAVYTGLREGELSGLEWPDIDLNQRLITVQRSYDTPTKNARIRHVPIPDPLAPLLNRWREFGVHNRLVFPNRSGKMHQQSAKVFDHIYFRCLAAAGIKKMNFHCLRHTYASHFMLNAGDIYKLRDYLGHSSVTVTERYAHLSPKAYEGDRARLPDFLPASVPE